MDEDTGMLLLFNLCRRINQWALDFTSFSDWPRSYGECFWLRHSREPWGSVPLILRFGSGYENQFENGKAQSTGRYSWPCCARFKAREVTDLQCFWKKTLRIPWTYADKAIWGHISKFPAVAWRLLQHRVPVGMRLLLSLFLDCFICGLNLMQPSKTKDKNAAK